MSVFRSNTNLYVQFIDDDAARTVASASTQTADFKGDKLSVETAKKLGKIAAEQARIAGVEQVVFDRGGFAYAGKIKALAEAARENGLKF
jgi:large subunit ribosomal protein L18